MSETTPAEVIEVETPPVETKETEQLPADHPLVKTLAAQKATIKELKGKAARLDEIEEAAKSEAEKTADRIAKAEAEAAAVPAKVSEALKSHLVELHGIDQEDAELFLTATEPDLLLKQVARLLGQSDKRRTRNRVPNEGSNPSATPNETSAFARDLLGG